MNTETLYSKDAEALWTDFERKGGDRRLILSEDYHGPDGRTVYLTTREREDFEEDEGVNLQDDTLDAALFQRLWDYAKTLA